MSIQNIKFEPMYPDVLGAITGGTRINMDQLQVALGVFPQRTFLNQPLELILILQNMIDQNMQVKVAIQLPSEDKKGNPVVIDTPKKMLSLGIRPGEVGVLRTPLVPRPPTAPGTQLPVRVAVRYRAAKPGRAVRPPSGGAPPSILGVSSFKLQVLRDVAFSAHMWKDSPDILTTYFDIAPKVMPDLAPDLKPRYESLWTHEEMAGERELVRAKIEDARGVANGLTRGAVYRPLLNAVDERFASRDLALHPGEVKAIAKMLTYALDEGMELEPGFEVESSRWFQTLCQVLAHDETVEEWDRGTLTIRYLFEAAMYDAILLGFSVIEPKVNEDLGNADERVSYANRVLSWYAGQGQSDLSYAYLPLVMGGIAINEFVKTRDENPWIMIEEMREALAGRSRLFTGELVAIFKLTDQLLTKAEESLRRSRVPRPD
jgi:hypothetical protein